MIKEINYLKEHLYEIYKYKKSQKDLTYDMDLGLLLRTCKALDFIQQENQQLKKSIKLFTDDLTNITNKALLLEKQKDDVVEYIKKLKTFDYFRDNKNLVELLRMLGEIDE